MKKELSTHIFASVICYCLYEIISTDYTELMRCSVKMSIPRERSYSENIIYEAFFFEVKFASVRS